MALNTSKTKFMIFRTRGKPINEVDCQLVYNSTELGHVTDPLLVTPIERVHNNGAEKSFKLLCVYFDEYLSFEPHISHLCTKLSKQLFCLNRVKNFVSQAALKKLYFALVHSSLTYCLNIYGAANKTTLQPLVLQQKKAIRIISRVNFRDHTGPLFALHEILPVESLIHFQRMKFMHNYYFKKLPFSFAELWLLNSERNPERILRNANDFYIPQPRIELVKRLPLFSFPTAWNSENEEKYIPSQPCFLKSLKKRLLENLLS
jgi:hypothetical protein